MRSYSRLRSHQSKKFVANKKTKTYLVWALFALNIFLLIFSLSKITYLDFITIKNVSVYGTRENISRDIQNKVLDIIDNSYIGLFSKANSLFYPKGTLLASIQSVAPQIQSLTINRDGLHGLRINVVEKIPKAKICANLPDFSEDENILDQVSNCYLADSSGQIFDKISTSTKNSLNLYFIPSLSDTSTSTGHSLLTKYATSTDEFTSLQNFYDSTKKAGLDPKFILIKDDGEYEMYANDTVIYFNNKRPIIEQLKNLIEFWNHNKNNNSSEDINYEYINIKYGSNIFYRQKAQ